MTFYPCKTEGCKRKTTKLDREGNPYNHCFQCNQTAKRDEIQSTGGVSGVCAIPGCGGVTSPMKSDKTRAYKNCDSCTRKARTYFAVSEVAYQASKAKDIFLALNTDDEIEKRAEIEEKLCHIENALTSIRSVLFDRLKDDQPLKKKRIA